MPCLLEPSTRNGDLGVLFRENASTLEERLVRHGALLFRGFDVSNTDDFDRFAAAVSSQRLNYTYRSTPRSALGNGIFTATEYPPSEEIVLHSENAYQLAWPRKVAFCCLKPATEGGETPIADMRHVHASIGMELIDRFESKGVRYIRHYRPYVDIPWQTVFQTTDRRELADYCEKNNIHHEWLDDDTLRTVQVCQGATYHPITGERVFFNQAHLFHVSSLGEKIARTMKEVFGEARLPRHSSYGDGTPIDLADLQRVRDSFAGAAVQFSWCERDVLLLDNMQVAHGRRPFRGPRKVIAALLDPHSTATILASPPLAGRNAVNL